MSLASGSKIGQYEILSLLGAGGMGEVYRARDTRLHREVAVKVLPEEFSQQPERLSRFEREAHLLAALNHPNIAAIYGFADGALVMELVEGQTLAEILEHGPIPPDRMLPLAAQIADALEAAHEKGIIHRDLKPGNIKITPQHTAKVLDFGIARFAAPELLATSHPDSATLTMSIPQAAGQNGDTHVGAVLGTASYMAPEQARGEKVDKRADIWSYGVVLFEMLTGHRPFVGRTTTEILANILSAEPHLEALPARFRPLIRRCLEKDPKRRLRDIGEARLLLESETHAPALRRSRRWMPLIALGSALAGAALMSFMYSRTSRVAPAPALAFHDVAGPPVYGGSGRGVVLSEDGTRLVYVAGDMAGPRRLATRLLSQSVTSVLAGTDGASYPFLSPDGRWVAFFAGGKLKKIPSAGGAILTLCDAPAGRGGAWSAEGVIVAALNNRGALSRLPAAGGVPPVTLTQLESGENCHRWPHFVPGQSKVFVFTAGSAGARPNASIRARNEYVGSGEPRSL